MSANLRNLLGACAIFLAPAAVAAPNDDVTNFTLENGLEVVVIEDHRSPAVVHMLWYKVGGADEVPGKSGIAHLLEHLMFKGTKNVEPGEFSRIVEINGGSENAFTSWDYTAYFQRVSADLLPQMMAFEADRMRNLRLTEAQTAPEVSVVLEERAQRTDSNPNALFREQSRAAQYLNHPYGRPIIGWKHEVSVLGPEDALTFYHQHYVPNNAVLVVAGDADPDLVRSLAEETYGKIAPNPDFKPRERVQEPPQISARRMIFEDPRIAQPYITRSYIAPERDSGAQETAAALLLLSDLLGGDSATSYLGRKLQFEKQMALFSGAYYRPVSLDDTTFNLTIAPAPGVTMEEIEAAMDEEVANFIAEGVDLDALARLKRQYAADAIYGKDNAQARARSYGAALTSGLTVADVQAWPDVVQAVTEEDILAAARQVLVPEHSVTGWLRPPSAAKKQEISQ